MWRQRTLFDIDDATSSQELPAGNTPYSLPDGRKIAPSGPAPVRVSRSRSPASRKEPPTNGIFGPNSEGLSPSAVLQLSLENRLRAALDVNGSPEYVLTWKHWDMPSGAPICALRALGRHISGKDFSGWATPQARDWKDWGLAIPQKARSEGDLVRSLRLDQLGRQCHLASGVSSTSSVAPTGSVGVLNPEHSRWLMGFPTEWANFAPTGMP